MKITKPELLIPVANIQKANFAIKFGADAIYAGTNQFGLRYNKNFADLNELSQIADFVHKSNKKLYITTNIFMHNNDISLFNKMLNKILNINPDALIVSDLGALNLLLEKRDKMLNKTEKKPPFEIHISTQANTTNFMTSLFYSRIGVDRIILARELTLKEIYEIKKLLILNNVKLKLETFIHGAMCISYSGRCLLSLYMTSPETSTPDNKKYRDANKGMCTHPCRWEYKIIEKKRDDEIFEMIEDNNYTYLMSSKDLNLLKFIPILILAGIDSFKVEGRMKSNHYIGATTYAYRLAIDKAFDILKNKLKTEESDFSQPYNKNEIFKSSQKSIKKNNNYKNYGNEVSDITNYFIIGNKIIENYIKSPGLFFNDFPQWLKYYNEIKKMVENFSHRPYTTGFYFINSKKDSELSATSNKYIEKMKYIGFVIYQKSTSHGFMDKHFVNFDYITGRNKDNFVLFNEKINNLRLLLNQEEETKIKLLLNDFEYLKKISNYNKKYLYVIYSKNKFVTKNNLIILQNNYRNHKNKFDYVNLNTNSYIILNLNLEKIEFTKHSNYYLLLTDFDIEDYAILLSKK